MTSALVLHDLTSCQGNYERYLSITLTRESNITTGKIYQYALALPQNLRVD
jgi:CTP synthase (UTP-ammonia lyase)